MPEQTEPVKPFNPFLLWTDWGMRAAEAAFSSTQNMAAQSWSRWMATMTSLMSARAGVAAPNGGPGQDNPLQAVRESLRSPTWAEMPATGERVARAFAATEPRGKSGTRAVAERALAAAEPKPRRKAAAKTKRTQRTQRTSRK